MSRTSVLLPVALVVIGMFPLHGRAGVRQAKSDVPAVHRAEAGEIIPRVVVAKVKPGALRTAGGLAKVDNALAVSLATRGVSSLRQMFPGTPAPGKSASLPDAVGLDRVFKLFLQEGIDPAVCARDLSGLPDIEYAEPTYYHRLYESPNDPLLSNQTGAFARMNVTNGWALGKGDASVIIADVDGGTDWRHEDLLANVHVNPLEDINHNGQFDAGDLNGVDDDGNGFVDDVVGWNFSNSTNDPSGVSSAPGSYAHGTATASHFGAVTNNGKGMAGSSWNCAIMPICVSSNTGDNLIAFGYEGIAYAYHNGAKVINCSWGRPGGFSQFEQDVITSAVAAGALVVAAAGNDGTNNDLSAHYPSNYSGVLAVGATNSGDDTKAAFSNYGKTVQVFAPGVNIWSAFVGGGYGNGGSGTSYSSPLTAGLAGILRVAHPAWTPVQIAAQIRTTADAIDNVNILYAGNLGRGRVNFARALTESHAALDLTFSDLRTTGGRKLFLPGDTLVLSMQLKNVLFVPATGCEVLVTTSDPSLEVIAGAVSVGTVGPGEEVTVPVMKFRVGSLSNAREVSLRAVWTYNATERDGAAFRAMLFPVVPLWLLQLDGSAASLYSVRAPNRDVVWASGGNGTGSSPLVVRSTNGGGTWSEVTGSLQGMDLYCVEALDAQRAWVGTSDGRIFATTSGGATWFEQPYQSRQSSFIDGIRMFADGTGYALGDPPTAPVNDGKFVVLKTTDYGATWSHTLNEPGLTSTEAGWNNSFWWADAQHGWFGTNKNRVWRTTNGGTTWASSATGGTNSYGVAFNDASNGYAVHDNGFVARSTDGGQSWSAVNIDATGQMAAVTSAPGVKSSWVATGSAPFHTRDNGVTWTAESLFPFSGSITHLSAPDSSIGWAVTSNGEVLCYSPTAFTAVGEKPHADVPVQFVLDQNFPNPFNPTTTVRFTIGGAVAPSAGEAFPERSEGGPAAAHVRLSVYDLLGREVAVLVNELKAPGTYRVAFDGRRLASGVYFYRLQASGEKEAGWRFIATKKMVLTK